MSKFKISNWRVALATALGATALLAACGGGGSDPDNSPVAATATSYSQGAITGFGSVFVGGVRYDDSGAAVSDDDGGTHNSSALKLGMMVEVDGANVDAAAGTARALRIRFGNEVLGPVGSVDIAASTVVVLGQTVLVTSSTVFDSTLSGGLSALTAGTVIEVHGILDTVNGRIVATRIEAEAAAPAYRLRGVVSALDTTAKTFKIGSETISYAGIDSAAVPTSLADGVVVRVLVQTTQVDGAWVATRLRSGVRMPDTPRPDAHVEGIITTLNSSTSFVVNGLTVDASNATFPDGTASLIVGARVEVHGTVTEGVLVATKVEVQERRDHGRRDLELRGELGNLDSTAKTFALRGVTVWFGGTVTYRDGTEADLANGKRVEVKGVLSADRTRLEATRIEIK
ncbi:MAG: hypothetical protein KA141_07300 [Rubrivivax sp.]|nr:hypothetical protein [Rubrivivax sp.]